MVYAIIALLIVSLLPAAGPATTPAAPPATAAAPSTIPAPAAAPPAEARPAPDFTFDDVRGAAHSMAEFHGHVTVLEFWAPWCIPCRKGFPFLDQLQAKHDAAGLKVVAVTMETDDQQVYDFLAKFPARFLVGREPSGRAGDLYEVAAMPTTLLIDRDGRMLARYEGGTDEVHQQLETAVETALQGGVVAEPSGAKRRQGPKGNLRAWERGYLADRIMNLDGDPLTRSMRDHIHTSKEAASGNGGVAGGGCGCN